MRRARTTDPTALLIAKTTVRVTVKVAISVAV
jgi:hypothetical protein